MVSKICCIFAARLNRLAFNRYIQVFFLFKLEAKSWQDQ